MDFIERIFGISPDGGDGSTEAAYLAAAAFVLVLVAAGLYLRKRRRLPPK
jgi:LPXTG-motif cell wall-anchored protein